MPLPRIVPIEGKHGDVLSKSFHNVRYIPVLHKEFTTIEIYIRDEAGWHVPFGRGRVTATLHFRGRKPSFFETCVTVVTVATVAVANIKSSAKRHLKETGKDMISKVLGSSTHGPPVIRLVHRTIKCKADEKFGQFR